MNAHRLTLVLGLALLWPAAAGAADGAYLSELTPSVDGDTLSLRLWIDGEASNSVALRPDGVQVTLEGAFLDPAKQHLAVDLPAVRDVFAYQYDPDTVRVRVLTQGLAPDALRDHVALRDDGRSLLLTISGLKAAKHAPVAAAPVSEAAPVPAETAKATEPAPESKIDRPEARPETAAARAAEARAEALATLKGLLDRPADKVEDASQDRAQGQAKVQVEERTEAASGAGDPARALGAGMQALVIPRSALMPDAPQGGGAPAEAAPDTKPSPVTEKAVHKPSATAKSMPVKASAPAEPAKAAETAPVPLKPLPHGLAERPDLLSSGLKMAGGLLLVLGLLAAGVAVLRRVRGAGLGGRTPIRVLASASLGSRQNIVVVEVEGRRLVVGVTPGGMELLADLTAQDTSGDAPGGDTADGPVRAVAPKATDSPFARALRQAAERTDTRTAGRGTERDAADALRRTTRDLQHRVKRLKARSA